MKPERFSSEHVPENVQDRGQDVAEAGWKGKGEWRVIRNQRAWGSWPWQREGSQALLPGARDYGEPQRSGGIR